MKQAECIEHLTQDKRKADKLMGYYKTCTLKIRGGCDRDRYGKKAGKGALVQWEKSATLGVSQDQTLFVWKATDTDHLTKVTDTE